MKEMSHRIALSVLVGSLLVALSGQARAAHLHPDQVRETGLVGLASDQTARFDVVNGSPQACQIDLKIVDSQDNTLAETSATLNPETGTFIDLPAETLSDGAGITPPNRVEVRGIATPESGCANMMPTLELFNNDTGVTTIALHAHRGSLSQGG